MGANAATRPGVLLEDERTLDDDPAFAIRMLVDVAIKALSPAVNDPTTAVQSLDRIEDLLRYAAPKHLSIGIACDGHGKVRLIYPVPTWEDLVELALVEQRHLLDDAVSSAIPQSQRADTLVPDRQGIGMSHRPPTNRH